MKNKKFLPLLVVTFTFALFFNGKKYDEMVTERLSTNVAICLEGQSCGAATASSSTSSMTESVEKVNYQKALSI